MVKDGTGRPHIILNTPVDIAFGSVDHHHLFSSFITQASLSNPEPTQDTLLCCSVVNDGTGRPHIILNTPVDVAFGSVGLHISGCRFSWLYNAVLGLVGGGLKPMIVEEVAGQLANIVPAQANEALKV